MIIWVDRPLCTFLLSGEFVGAICDDLIRVHIGLCSATRLPHDERKLIIKTPLQTLFTGLQDKIAQAVIKFAQPGVGTRGSGFDDKQRANK